MNNLDKLIVKNKRNRYYREPVLSDILIEYHVVNISSWSVIFTVGDRSYGRGVITNSLFIKLKRVIDRFNDMKGKLDLEEICSLLSININTLLSMGYRKGLLTKEGIEFVKKLYNRIARIIDTLTMSIDLIQELELDISVVHPRISGIYAVSNVHLSGLSRESMYLKNLLKVNGVIV
jgi:hypothetical protein